MVVLKGGGGSSSFKGGRGRGKSVTAGVLRRKILLAGLR